MMSRVPFSNLLAQYEQLKEQLDLAISEAIKGSTFIGGKNVEDFEEGFKKLIGVNNCVSCANGTDAIYIAVKGLGLKAGDEVITTAHSWIATSEAVTQAGGKVIFCDTTRDTFCIDGDQIEDKITSRTVGIIPVHLYGHPADMIQIMKIAAKHKLWVLEDCAQAHLSTLDGRNAGCFGDVATYSFYPGKNLEAMGDAGAIVTDNNDLAEWCSLFARHGGKGRHVIEGVNSRMDSIQAAILNVKMPHLSRWTTERRKAAMYYSQRLQGLLDIKTPVEKEGAQHVYHLYTVLCNRRDELRAHLKKHGVETNINYPVSLPFLPAYSYMSKSPRDFPVAHESQSRILSLPLFPEISRDQQDYVCDLIYHFLEA